MEEEKKQYVVRTSSKDKKTAMILCVLLGLIGIHDFYLGRIGSGILKMFTGNFFMFGWISDIIKIATGTYKDGAGEPLRK